MNKLTSCHEFYRFFVELIRPARYGRAYVIRFGVWKVNIRNKKL